MRDTVMASKPWRSWHFLPYWRTYVLILTPILLLPLLVSKHQEAHCAYVVCIMAIYWMTEALPLFVTGLLPLIGFPLLGIMSTAELCPIYMKETIMMFIGGLIMATAVEHCNLHKRIAIYVILHVGQSPRRLMAGFMFTTMFLSMWNYNTASTAMMIPIVDAIMKELYSKKSESQKALQDNIKLELQNSEVTEVEQTPRDSKEQTKIQENCEEVLEIDPKKEIKFENQLSDLNLTDTGNEMRKALLTSVAFSANIGGTGVVTGTGPNLVLMALLEESFSEPTGLNFASWMVFNIPTAVICVAVSFLWLQFYFIRKEGMNEKSTEDGDLRVKKLIQAKYDSLGKISFHEVTVLVLYILLVTLWFFKSPKFIPGWGLWFRDNEGRSSVGNSTAAMIVIVLLFAIPKELNFWCFRDPKDTSPERSVEGCITWDVIHKKIPWGIVFLVGGGFTMGEASRRSGLSIWVGELLKGLTVFPSALIVLVVSIITAMATELVSNMAMAAILLPVFKNMSLDAGLNPIYLMLPAAIACSYAFMLPVATATNALVFSAGKMKPVEMMKPGLVMNFLCIIVMNVMINTLGVALFDLRTFPSWTNSTMV